MQLPDSYEFFSQAKINSGKKAMEHIPFELAGMDARKPVVLTNRQLAGKGAGKKLVRALYDSNVVIGGLFDNVYPYASAGQIEELAGLFHDRGCDSIIAVGGSAVMNAAKGLNILVSEKKNIMEFAGENRISGRLKPLVYVAVGESDCREVSGHAYIENRDFVSDFLCPDIVILDDRMAGPGSASAVADSSLIALTYSVEAFAWQNQNMVAGLYAGAALNFIFEHLPVAVKKPHSKKACLALANACTAAGIAMSNSGPGMAGLLGMAIAENTGLPKGICMGAVLPHRLEAAMSGKEKIRGELLYAMKGLDEFCAVPDSERPQRSVYYLKKLIHDLGGMVPESLRELNIPEYRLQEFASAAAEKSGGRFKQKECLNLLESAWIGTGEVN